MNTTQTSTAIKTTVLLTWTDAPVVRIKVNQPLVEYGLREGQVVYLVKSNTLNKVYQGEGAWYHILTWNYATTEWQCPCAWQGRNCRHVRLAKQACATRVERCKQVAEKVVRYVMSMPKMEVHRYCDSCQCALPLKQVNGKHVCNVCASHQVKGKHAITKSDAPLQGHGFQVINGIPMR